MLTSWCVDPETGPELDKFTGDKFTGGQAGANNSTVSLKLFSKVTERHKLGQGHSTRWTALCKASKLLWCRGGILLQMSCPLVEELSSYRGYLRVEDVKVTWDVEEASYFRI